MEMKRSLIALVVVLLLVLHLANQAYSARFIKRDKKTCIEEPKKCIRAYEKINARLDSYDVKDNMEDITSWIRTMTRRVDGNKSNLNDEEYNYLMALYRIQGLYQLESVGICKTTTVTLLHDSDVALKNALAKREPGEGLRDNRLVFMLKNYLDKYLEKCDCGPRLAKFDILLKRARKGAKASGKLVRIKAVIGELIGSNAQSSLLGFNIFEPSEEDVLTYVDRNPISASSFAERHMNSLGSRSEDVKIIKRYLREWAVEDHIKQPEEGHEFLELFQNYIIKPCKLYNIRLESLFSGKWIKAQAVKHYKENDMNYMQIYKHEAYYHGCGKLLYAQVKLTEELEKVESEGAY